MSPARRRLVAASVASVALVAAGVGVWLALGGSGDDSRRAAQKAPSAPSTASTMPATTTTTTAPVNVRISAATSYAAGFGCPNGPSYEFALQGRTVTLVSIAGTPAAGNPSAQVANDGVYFLAFQAPNGVASTLSGRIHPTTVSGTSKQGDCIYTFAGRA